MHYEQHPGVPGSFGGETALNYRHLFHAGNFADVLKHALLMEAVACETARPGALQVLDTHAGAGAYDLGSDAARRAGEAQAGVLRLMDDPDPPPALARLQAAVRAANGSGTVRLYPGSPRLAVDSLRPGDGWTGCELRPDDAGELRRALSPAPAGVQVCVREADGWAQAARPAPAGARRLVLIDPPFERADDGLRLADAFAACARRGEAVVAWAPLKDLDGYDRLLRRAEAGGPGRALAVQVRLRPLADPLRMNGCVLWMAGLDALAPAAQAAADWVAARCGGPGALARVEAFGG